LESCKGTKLAWSKNIKNHWDITSDEGKAEERTGKHAPNPRKGETQEKKGKENRKSIISVKTLGKKRENGRKKQGDGELKHFAAVGQIVSVSF